MLSVLIYYQFIYGKGGSSVSYNDDTVEEDDDELFKVRKAVSKTIEGDRSDFSRSVNKKHVLDWEDEECLESIRNRFVTGDWNEETPVPADQEEADEAINDASDVEVEDIPSTKAEKKKRFDAEYDAENDGVKDYFDLTKEQLNLQNQFNLVRIFHNWFCVIDQFISLHSPKLMNAEDWNQKEPFQEDTSVQN